jgi:hypothetical protein
MSSSHPPKERIMKNTQQFTSVARQLVQGFGTTAHTVIDAYREGGERLGSAARQRWDAALKQSSPQLDAQTRKNAAHAQAVFGGYYAKGIDLSAAGAKVAVDTVVQVANTALERAAAWQQGRA